MTIDRFKRLKLGSGLTGTDLGSGILEVEASGGSGIPDTLLDAKGDLIAASAADTADRLPVGSDGDVLTADSGETTGIKWEAPAGGPSSAPPALMPWVRTGSTEDRWYAAGLTAGGALTTAAGLQDQIIALPLIFPRDVTIDRVAINVVANSAGTNVRLGIYNDDGNLYPSSLLLDSGAISTASPNGVKTATVSQALTAGTIYWGVYLSSSGVPTYRALNLTNVIPILGSPATLTTGLGYGWFPSQSYGALPGTFPAAATSVSPINQFPAIYFRAT